MGAPASVGAGQPEQVDRRQHGRHLPGRVGLAAAGDVERRACSGDVRSVGRPSVQLTVPKKLTVFAAMCPWSW
jgi:hypothetical protein